MTHVRFSEDGLTLQIERVMDAPRSAVWRCWTEPDLLKQWFCPKPWRVAEADFDLRPGGRMNTVMRGPDGEDLRNDGIWLEVVSEERLAFTDAYGEDFIPREEPFLTAFVRLSDTANGGTRMVWGARHFTEAGKRKHLEMGFEWGWTTASAQLADLARSVAAGSASGPASDPSAPTVRTSLWYDGNAEEAVAFYVALLPGSRIESTFRPSPDAPALMINFTLQGTPYQALNGGPEFRFNEAASISVVTENQAETDRLWDRLTTDGGTESMCGWLKDRYGLSWQIVPKALPRLLASADREAAGRAMAAMMKMRKIDIAALTAAFAGA